MEVAENQTLLSPGDILGCYRVENFLGQGGFGVTYLALDTMLDLRVAIKEYMPEKLARRMPDLSVRPQSQEVASDFSWGLSNFIKEAQTLARFRHPNIVRVMSVFELNGTAYMVMEYESGQDLKMMLNRSGSTSQQQLEQIIGPIVDGLQQVHSHGYIHRDIKPANILIRTDGTPVLLDFGSARQSTESRTKGLTALVTAGFAPLEQYTGSNGYQQGPWTDVYALGAVLYFAITGKAPIDSALRGSAVLNDRPDPLVTLTRLAPSGYSPAFCRAIDWAMSFKVAKRPQSLAQWRSRLLADSKTWRPPEVAKINRELPESFFREIDERAQTTAAVDNLATAQTLGPADPTIVQVRASGPSANTGRFETSAEDLAPLASSDETWDTDYVSDRVFERRETVKTPLFSGKFLDWSKKLAAGVASFVLVGAMIVLLFPQLLTIGGSDIVTGLTSDSVPAVDAQVRQEQGREEPDQIATVPSAPLVSDGATSDAMEPAPDALRQATPSLAIDADIGQPLSEAASDSARDSRLAVARAVQASEARRQVEIERQRRLAESERLARQLSNESTIDENPFRGNAGTGNSGQRQPITESAARPESGSFDKADDSPGNSAGVSAGVSSEDSDRLTLSSSSQTNPPEPARLFRPAITDRDMAVVLRQFDALSLAIEKRDGAALRRLTEPSARKYAYFDYLFETFESIEVVVSNIQGSRQEQTIRGSMLLRRMIRANGDIVFPPKEFQKIPLRSVRGNDWSKIYW